MFTRAVSCSIGKVVFSTSRTGHANGMVRRWYGPLMDFSASPKRLRRRRN